MHKILLSAALLSTAAATQSPASPDPQRVAAGTYAVDPDHTQVNFGVSHLGFTTYTGVFSGASGSLSIDPGRVAATALDVSVPVDSVRTTSAKLDGELRSADWLDADAHPAMRFRSVTVTPTGAGTAKVAGELTLHGVTRPVTLAARFVGAGTNPITKLATVGFHGDARIRRSDYGVKTYLPVIGDEVTISIEAAFQSGTPVAG